MSVDPDEDTVVALSKRAGPDHFIQIRSQTQRTINPVKDVPAEEQGDLRQVEINYV